MSTRANHRASSTLLPLPDALARLFDAVREGIYIGTLDSETSVTLAANPHLKLMFGYPPETPSDLIRPFELARFVDAEAKPAFISQLKRDGAVTDYLLRLRRADESPVWVEVTANLETPNGGSPYRVQALLRDVSERRKLEDQGRDVYHQLMQAEKLAALGQTVSSVAHELNNPLATILTWAERLSSRPVDSITKRGLDTILSESERAAKIVRNLLTFSRKRHTTRAMVNLNQVVRETLALRAYEQGVSNILAIDALAVGLPRLFADPYQLKQVFLNLIINAEQAMLSANGRGALIVRTWHEAEKDSVVLEINDDGPGVPEEVQSKIFDPFFTTKVVGKGTGLGLTVAYAIIQDHGGQIRVASSGRGASFYVELPTVNGLPARSPTPVPPRNTTVGAGANVLVVEDERALAEAVSAALVDVGFRVDLAGDGREALEKVNAQGYDLVICDLSMPRVDGPAFYAAVSKTIPSLTSRIVFVTGEVVSADTERFLEESGCQWLGKPFRLAELLKVAREVLG